MERLRRNCSALHQSSEYGQLELTTCAMTCYG